MTFRLDTESLNKEPIGSQNLQQSQDRRSIVCLRVCIFPQNPSLTLSFQSCMQSQTVGHTTDLSYQSQIVIIYGLLPT